VQIQEPVIVPKDVKSLEASAADAVLRTQQRDDVIGFCSTALLKAAFCLLR